MNDVDSFGMWVFDNDSDILINDLVGQITATVLIQSDVNAINQLYGLWQVFVH